MSLIGVPLIDLLGVPFMGVLLNELLVVLLITLWAVATARNDSVPFMLCSISIRTLLVGTTSARWDSPAMCVPFGEPVSRATLPTTGASPAVAAATLCLAASLWASKKLAASDAAWSTDLLL